MKNNNRGAIKWKKNFLKIPAQILNKIKNKSLDKFIVACVKKIPLDDIKANKYNQLDIKWDGDKVGYQKIIIPKPTTGKYSSTNIYGKEIIRKDLPKISKSFTWDVPNYGDWSNGSHDITIDRDVYQREFISPKELEIETKLMEYNEEEKTCIIKFSVNEIIYTDKKGWQDDLLYNINILQENVGAVDIYPPDTKDEEYLKTIYVDWEILPVGTKDILERILSGAKVDSPELKKKYVDRYNLLNKLKPILFINGTNSFRRYFGAKFADNLIVFENLEYGNAIYVMNENWEKLSKLSRIDLLKMKNREFVRIVHINNWEASLKNLILENTNK